MSFYVKRTALLLVLVLFAINAGFMFAIFWAIWQFGSAEVIHQNSFPTVIEMLMSGVILIISLVFFFYVLVKTFLNRGRLFFSERGR